MSSSDSLGLYPVCIPIVVVRDNLKRDSVILDRVFSILVAPLCGLDFYGEDELILYLLGYFLFEIWFCLGVELI